MNFADKNLDYLDNSNILLKHFLCSYAWFVAWLTAVMKHEGVGEGRHHLKSNIGITKKKKKILHSTVRQEQNASTHVYKPACRLKFNS